jgi:hypothetical protein
MTQQEVLDARRAFPKAQQLLASPPLRRLAGSIDVGWYGTEVHPETGSFALVRDGADLDDLIGEVVIVTVGMRSVYAYVIGARGIPTDVALARRAFLSIGRLSHESLPAVVEVAT